MSIDLPKTREELASRIDHTNLSPDAKREAIDKTIRDAKAHRFRSICIPPFWVPYAKRSLKTIKIPIDTVIGFPLGFTSTEAKMFETKWVLDHGADEIDMVMNLSAFKSGAVAKVKEEIARIVNHVSPKVTKVIIETPYLNPKEIKRVSKLVVDAGAMFVKSCTGFGPRGVTEKDVQLMREAIGKRGKIKAAGGIGDAKKALKMMRAGANVIGASRGVEIMETFKPQGDKISK
ncbi:MAG: deoxyribose-phosphate aldolase [Candidatus Korarchaeota archaeon]|nr:deoxyribose-phosphate aldolase [Candidatus Korarchaeota archaeon]NIU82272.1 deoxyribose-phosphate aldolase [Candidatus Thorarchaeota archaeon]NIW12726.1 deoxyribose-phosphate aldolase [Candidatus Thorarchaeota archaeon]NIW50937.1 deoxyribose-phosphate aldolase [Candidatus Korarchaeota archaeon]